MALSDRINHSSYQLMTFVLLLEYTWAAKIAREFLLLHVCSDKSCDTEEYMIISSFDALPKFSPDRTYSPPFIIYHNWS